MSTSYCDGNDIYNGGGSGGGVETWEDITSDVVTSSAISLNYEFVKLNRKSKLISVSLRFTVNNNIPANGHINLQLLELPNYVEMNDYCVSGSVVNYNNISSDGQMDRDALTFLVNYEPMKFLDQVSLHSRDLYLTGVNGSVPLMGFIAYGLFQVDLV